jgi:hypothetical protein
MKTKLGFFADDLSAAKARDGRTVEATAAPANFRKSRRFIMLSFRIKLSKHIVQVS